MRVNGGRIGHGTEEPPSRLESLFGAIDVVRRRQGPEPFGAVDFRRESRVSGLSIDRDEGVCSTLDTHSPEATTRR